VCVCVCICVCVCGVVCICVCVHACVCVGGIELCGCVFVCLCVQERVSCACKCVRVRACVACLSLCLLKCLIITTKLPWETQLLIHFFFNFAVFFFFLFHCARRNILKQNPVIFLGCTEAEDVSNDRLTLNEVRMILRH
jgi:hypothetical protein